MLLRRFACLPALICLLSCSSDHSSSESAANGGSDTEIRWTSYGIPHVKANDWESLGYGFAYATATDAVCVIAQDIVMINSNLSVYMGAENGNYESDVFHRAVLTSDKLQRFALAQPDDSSRFAKGYVAGYNLCVANS